MTDFSRRAFFDSHPDPMWVYDPETLRFLDANESAQSRYGYRRDEFLAMSVADIRPAEDVDRLLEAVASAERGLEERGVWRHRLKSGEIIFVHTASRQLDYDGKIARLVSARDVTRLVELERQTARLIEHETQTRRRAEAASHQFQATNLRLQEQEANLRTAQRLLGLGIWKLDLETGTLWWSDNLYQMYGTTRELFGHTVAAYIEMVHPDDRATTVAGFQKSKKNPEPDFHFQHRIVRSDGTIAHVRGVGELTVSPNRRVLTGVIQDITSQLEADARLAEATRLLSIAGRAARLGGWRVELNPNRLIWSPETAAIHEVAEGTQISIEEAINYYVPAHRAPIEAAFRSCIRDGKPFDEILQFVTAKGNRIWVRSIGEAERSSDGTIVAVQGAIQDISELVAVRERSEDLSRRLHDTLENISDAFFTVDEGWRFTFLNGQAERLLDRSRSTLIGKVVWDEFPGTVGTTFQKEYERAVATRETVRFTEFYSDLDTWFQVSAYPIPDGLAVYFSDVTRDLARDQQLRLLETAVARQNDILLITEAEPIDAPDGPRIVYVNDAFVRRTGYSREEAIGNTPRILQGPNSSRGELNRIREALKQWKPVRAELINYAKSGEEFCMEVDLAPIADGNGRYTHWVGVQRDITERKRAEQAMRVSDARFRLIAKATSDVIWDWDLVQGRVWWNEAGCSLLGSISATQPEAPETWRNHIHPEDRSRVLHGIYKAAESGEANWVEDYRFMCGDGRTVFVIDRGFIIRDEHGKAIRMLGSMIDVTEQRERDEQLRQSQKLEAVGQLTGGVAHDFNNLLTIILGNAELLTERLTDQQQLRLLAEMTATAAERGAELTNRLLAFARRQPLEPALLDVNRLLAGMDRLLRRTLAEDIQIEMVRGGGLWAAEVDPGQLEVALLNLAINARDAMPDGGRLTLETGNATLDDNYARQHHEVEPGQYVMVSVSDTGAGMPRDVAERAFEPFFTTKEVGKGSGLGLSMVYGFVKQSRGHAKIYSEVGNGTTVKLYLPRGHADGALQATAEELQVVGGDEQILVVEDDDLVRQHLQAQLRLLGYRVTGAASGRAALEVLKQMHHIDLLFTDIVMPGGMNGRQLAEAARALRPGIKVLFTSGYTENAIVHHDRLDPGVHLLGKPYRRQELAAKVRKVLDE